MLCDLPCSSSQFAASTCTCAPPSCSRCSTADQAYWSGSMPAQAVFSNSSSVRSICALDGSSSGAQAITPDLCVCSNSSESATAATSCGSPRRTSISSRFVPRWSISLNRYSAASTALPVPWRRNLISTAAPAQLGKLALHGDQMDQHPRRIGVVLVGVHPSARSGSRWRRFSPPPGPAPAARPPPRPSIRASSAWHAAAVPTSSDRPTVPCSATPRPPLRLSSRGARRGAWAGLGRGCKGPAPARFGAAEAAMGGVEGGGEPPRQHQCITLIRLTLTFSDQCI